MRHLTKLIFHLQLATDYRIQRTLCEHPMPAMAILYATVFE
jgi:hypothetical protein